jgi:hypothetical protein
MAILCCVAKKVASVAQPFLCWYLAYGLLIKRKEEEFNL